MGSDELTLFLSITLTGIAVPAVLMLIATNVDSEVSRRNILKNSKGLGVIAIIGFVFFSALLVMTVIQSRIPDSATANATTAAKIFGYVAFPVIYLIIISLFLMSYNFKFVFETDFFVYRNMFGITRKFSYSEITRVVKHYYPDCKPSNTCIIYVGKLRIELNMLMSNYNYFADEILKIRLKQAKNPVVIEKKIKGEKNKP